MTCSLYVYTAISMVEMHLFERPNFWQTMLEWRKVGKESTQKFFLHYSCPLGRIWTPVLLIGCSAFQPPTLRLSFMQSESYSVTIYFPWWLWWSGHCTAKEFIDSGFIHHPIFCDLAIIHCNRVSIGLKSCWDVYSEIEFRQFRSCQIGGQL